MEARNLEEAEVAFLGEEATLDPLSSEVDTVKTVKVRF